MKGRVTLDVEVACSPEDGYICTGKECWFKDEPDPEQCSWEEYETCICLMTTARLAADQLYAAAQKEGEV